MSYHHEIDILEGSTVEVRPDPAIFEVIRNRTNHPKGARASVVDDKVFRLDAEQIPRFIRDVNMAAGDLEDRGDERLYKEALALRNQLRETDRILTDN